MRAQFKLGAPTVSIQPTLVAESGAREVGDYKRLVLPFQSPVSAWSFNSKHLDRNRVMEGKEANQLQSRPNSLTKDTQRLHQQWTSPDKVQSYSGAPRVNTQDQHLQATGISQEMRQRKPQLDSRSPTENTRSSSCKPPRGVSDKSWKDAPETTRWVSQEMPRGEFINSS